MVQNTDEHRSLIILTDAIEQKLTEAVDVLTALDEIIDGDRRIEPLYKFVYKNVKTSLDNIDECKELIGMD